METSNLFFKTIIVEDKPTANRRIYRKGFLQKIKDKLQDGIENRKCFVTLDYDIDMASSVDTMLKKGLLAGIVVNFEIENGQGIIEVFPLKGTISGDRLIRYDNSGIPLGIDFKLHAKLEDTEDTVDTEDTEEKISLIDNCSYVSMNNFTVEPVLVVLRNTATTT